MSDLSRRRFNNDLKNSNKKIINIKEIEMLAKRKKKRVIKRYIIKFDIINNEILLIDIIKKEDNVFILIHIIKDFILSITNSFNA